jgi:hypothetical protein
MKSGDGVTNIYDNPGGVEQFFKTFNPSGVVSSCLCLSTGFHPGLLTFNPFGVVCPEVSGQFTPCSFL